MAQTWPFTKDTPVDHRLIFFQLVTSYRDFLTDFSLGLGLVFLNRFLQAQGVSPNPLTENTFFWPSGFQGLHIPQDALVFLFILFFNFLHWCNSSLEVHYLLIIMQYLHYYSSFFIFRLKLKFLLHLVNNNRQLSRGWGAIRTWALHLSYTAPYPAWATPHIYEENKH